MRNFALILLALALCACPGCESANAPARSGPAAALDAMAKSMDANDSQAFLARVDLDQYANNYVRGLADANQALSSLNAIGKMLGVGNLDELIGGVVDMKAKLADRFNRGVATGELAAECRVSINADCPWVPESLRGAAVVELGPDAAIAKITTPAKITSWLALRKIGGQWKVVGQAAMEGSARSMAAKAAPAAAGGSQI